MGSLIFRLRIPLQLFFLLSVNLVSAQSSLNLQNQQDSALIGNPTVKDSKRLTLDQQQRYKNDILPATVKAVLVFDNYARVILDSTASEQLAKQGIPATFNKKGQLVHSAYNFPPVTDHLQYYNVYAGKGNNIQVTLPDGTKIWLNAGSSIFYPVTFNGKERKVDIAGEVYVEVAYNASKPFIASIPGMEVRTLGAHFNLNAYGEEASIRTTLLKGSLNVKTTRDPRKSQTIKPAEQVRVGRYGDLSVVENADLKEVMAWKNDRFYSTNTDLSVILRQIARWYDAEMQFEGSLIGMHVPSIPTKINISRNVPVSEVLRLLELGKRVYFKIKGRLITVME